MMRIDGLIQGQALNVSALSDILSKLNPGDVLRAQVLEIMTSEVLLKLFDGTTFKASTLADLEARKGEFANFIVKNKADNQILLEQVKNGASKGIPQQDVLAKQLSSIGVEPNSQNLEIAGKMNANFVQLRKEMFESVHDMLGQFKNLDIAKAVFMASNQMVANEQNVEALSQLINTKMQVGSEVDQLIQLLGEVENTAASQLNAAKATFANANLASEDLQQFIEAELSSASNDSLDRVIKGFNLKDKILELVENAMKNPDGDTDKGIQSFIKSIPAMLRPKERMDLTDFIKNLVGKLSPVVEGEVTSIDNGGLEKLEKLKSDLEKAFVKVGDSSQLEKDLEANHNYRELSSKLETLREALSSMNFSGRDELLQKAENLQNNLRFINSVNEHNTYVQIPLNWMNKNSTGELYILKRESKRKKIDPDNTTLFIALNTQNIGRIESLITVNKRSIALNIRVEDPKVMEFMKGTYKELYQRIQDKGYKLADVKYRLIDQPVDVVNVNEIVTREINQGKITLDVKI